MDFRHSWKNSFPKKIFLIHSALLWCAAFVFLLLICLTDFYHDKDSLIVAIISFSLIANLIIFLSYALFASDISSLWHMIRTFSTNYPQAPKGIVQSSLNQLATYLYDTRVRQDRINAEKQREQQKQIEQQKEIMRSRQIIANNINHEIKTPIGIIQGYIDTLIEHSDEISPEMRKHFMQKCLNNTIRLQNMAYNLSIITRIENGKEAIQMDDINLVDTVNSVFDDLAPILERNGLKVVNNLPQKFIVHSNPTVLYNIFSNLSKNAAFYSGGTMIVTELIDEHHLSFRDNGKGVDEEFLDKIFNRFYRIDRDKNKNLSSSGLGLAIVKESIQMHDWTIKACNHPDGGLQFIITL